MASLKIEPNQFIPPGTQALTKCGEVVCTCRIGDPIEDADIDGIIMHPADIERLNAETDKRSEDSR